MSKRVLIIRLDRIGDVLLSTPAIRAVREAYPKAHIACMVRPYARDIVAENRDLDETIVYDKSMGIVGTVRFIRYLRKQRFDLAIVLHPTSRSHLVTFLARIPERVGYDRKLGWLLTKRVPHTKHLGLRHEIEYVLELLRHVGIEAGTKKMSLEVTTESRERAAELLARHGIAHDDAVICVHPGASCRSKRWSPRRFAEAADRLAAQCRAKIVIVAGPDDKEVAGDVASAMRGPCVNLAGETGVMELACILERARLFVSNDSGPVHIACAVGTPVVALFGRSDRGLSPVRWAPSNEGDAVLHKDVGCVACRAHNCRRGFKCLEAITVDDVLSAAGKVMEKR